MKLSTKQFARLVELFSDTDLEVRKYSGRCMYGDCCFAVVGSIERLVEATVYVCKEIADEARLLTSDEDEEVNYQELSLDDLVQALGRTRQDSMGMDSVWYWPDLEWPNDVEEPDAQAEE